MKIIYMEQTINLIAAQSKELASAIIQSGVVKELDGLKYLLIEENEQ